MKNRIVTGEWDGELITREETAEETLSRRLDGVKLEVKSDNKENKIYPTLRPTDPDCDVCEGFGEVYEQKCYQCYEKDPGSYNDNI